MCLLAAREESSNPCSQEHITHPRFPTPGATDLTGILYCTPNTEKIAPTYAPTWRALHPAGIIRRLALTPTPKSPFIFLFVAVCTVHQQ